jgi:hypothetical protein
MLGICFRRLPLPRTPSAARIHAYTPRIHILSLVRRASFMPTQVNTSERLAALRALMRHSEPPVGAYIVPSEDQRAFGYVTYKKYTDDELLVSL